MATKAALRRVMVLMESLAGTGHQRVLIRSKADSEKLQAVRFDPIVQSFVLYEEKKKIRTLRLNKKKRRPSPS